MIRIANRAISLVLTAALCADPVTLSAAQILRISPTTNPYYQNLQLLFEQEAFQTRLVQAYADEGNKSIAAPLRVVEGHQVLAFAHLNQFLDPAYLVSLYEDASYEDEKVVDGERVKGVWKDVRAKVIVPRLILRQDIESDAILGS